jgi:hypothetical protein
MQVALDGFVNASAAGWTLPTSPSLSTAYLTNRPHQTPFQLGASSFTISSQQLATSVSRFASDEAVHDIQSNPSEGQTPTAHLGTLQAQDLSRAAKLARLSGLCYLQGAEQQDLEQKVAQEGMRLVASGNTYFTR